MKTGIPVRGIDAASVGTSEARPLSYTKGTVLGDGPGSRVDARKARASTRVLPDDSGVGCSAVCVDATESASSNPTSSDAPPKAMSARSRTAMPRCCKGLMSYAFRHGLAGQRRTLRSRAS